MTAAVINIEAIKRQLTKTGRQTDSSFVFSREAIRNMVKALEFSDQVLSNEIETFLVKTGKEALPEVVKGLSSANLNVKSVCAMVLIRIGAPSIAFVESFYAQADDAASLDWVVEFIMAELGQAFVPAARTETTVCSAAMAS